MEPINRRYLTYECKKDDPNKTWGEGWYTYDNIGSKGEKLPMRMKRIKGTGSET